MSSFSKLLGSYIDKSGLTLDEIADKCRSKGIEIHPTYISKLRKGTRSSPSEVISRALAEVCDEDPDELVFKGYLDKTPDPIREMLDKYNWLFNVLNKDIIHLVKNNYIDSITDTLAKNTYEEPSKIKERLIKVLENFDSIPAEKQLSLISELIETIEINDDDTVTIYYKAHNTKEKTKVKHIIPILGTIRAGVPILAKENWGETLEIPSDIIASFALEVKGDSMIGAGIHEGDYAICQEAEQANPGSIVIALEDIGSEISEATLKYYIVEGGHSLLRPANPEYKDIPMGERHRIAGVMVSLLRKRPTPISYYKDYISIKDYKLKPWNEVIAKAISYGVKPEKVISIIEMVSEMVNKK